MLTAHRANSKRNPSFNGFFGLANIYIHMEIRKRELDGKFLLASKAALRGHRVMLGYLHNLLSKDLLTPGIFHDKSLTPRPKKFNLLRKARAAGHAYTSIDEEHGLLQKNYDIFAGQRYSAETIDLASAVMFWGAHDYGFIAANYPEQAHKLHPTGNPRADLWRPEMAEVFRQDLAVRRPFILLSSNLGSIFGQRPIGEIVAHMREGYFKGAEDETEFNIYKLHAYSTLLGGEYVRALRRLALTFPDVDFVLRPHPVENPAIWKSLIGDYKNIIVTNAGSVTPWIRQCTAIIHNGCTTAMEAVMSGIPVLTYTPIVDQNAEFYFPNLLGKRVNDLPSLIESVGQVLTSTSAATSSGEDLRVLGERFANADGTLAADRIVDVWDSVAQPQHTSNSFWKAGGKPFFKAMGDFLDVYRVATPQVLKLLRAKKIPVLPQKFDVWTQAQLESLQGRFSRQFPEFRQLKVTQIAPRICTFERAQPASAGAP